MLGVLLAIVIPTVIDSLRVFYAVLSVSLFVPIVAGLQLADTTRILSGALPAAALALLVDSVLAGVERLLKPRGVG